MKEIRIKRIYEDAAAADGYRILVDRIWPRGISKEVAKLDEWDKSIAPTSALRKWFDHQPPRYDAFVTKYKEELALQKEDIDRIRKIAKTQQVTLLYGAKNTEMNQAVVLKAVLNNEL